MIQGLFVLLLMLLAGGFLCRQWHLNNPSLNLNFMRFMLFYHFALSAAYFIYVLNNPSDSKLYYAIVEAQQYGANWLDYYGTSTFFVHFLAYPFVNYLAFTYESTMVIFAFFGFVGFLFAYSFISENIKAPVKIFGFDGIMLILLLPNCHFWTASLGKGSVIFVGMMMLFWGVSNIKSRWSLIILASMLVYHVRPHIFFVVVAAIALGFSLARGRTPVAYRALIILLSLSLLIYLYQDILSITGLDDESLLDPFISHRAKELSKATSGIDIANYNFFQKIFAFLFRPLFFDAPGLLGIIVSFENLLYLIMFLNFLRPAFIRYFFKADPLVKSAFFAFASVTVALAQISGNLGLAMRQKSQVMLLIFFVLLKFQEQAVLSRFTQWIKSRKLAPSK